MTARTNASSPTSTMDQDPSPELKVEVPNENEKPMKTKNSPTMEKPTTTTKTTLKQISKTPGRRLVDYFVVVSSLPRKDSAPVAISPNVSFSAQFDNNEIPHNISLEEHEDVEEELNFEPVITARYPLEDHRDQPLHQSVACFCHPAGIIKLKSKACLPKIHYFVMTGGRGTLMYGVCLTVHESFSITVKSSTMEEPKLIEMYIPKCICILSAYPYLVAFREYLTQLDRLTRRGDMTIPVERYITNFCAEIPAPPPGSFEVQTTINDSVIKIWSPPHNQPISWVSLPFSHLFECLDIENIVKVWHAMALERQVLLVSTQLTLLTTCSEILLSLLFPLKWNNAYIPLLPKFLIPILSAPMAYVIGLEKSYLGDAYQHLSSECIVVDLDTNQVSLGPKTPPLPPLPQSFEKELKLRLQNSAGMIFREARSLRKDDDFSERGQHLYPHIKVMADAMWESKLCLYDEAFHLTFTPEQSRNSDFLNGNDNSAQETSEDGDFDANIPMHSNVNGVTSARKQSRWDAVQETFMGIFVDLLCPYRKCLIFPSKDYDGATDSAESHGSGSYGGAGFRTRDFIKSSCQDKRHFLSELVNTQMFDEFITKRLYGSGAADVVFFDHAIDRYMRRHGMLVDNSSHESISPSSSPTTRRGRPSSAPVSIGGRILARVKGIPSSLVEDDDPLLRSARVHRKLKTIVPPDPYGDELNDDNVDIGYTYSSFPSRFDKDLFSEARPLPPAVLAEFNRQKDDAAQFRRKLKKFSRGADKSKPSSPEEATFSVFFVVFTAMIGKELVDLTVDRHQSIVADEREILATHTMGSVTSTESEDADFQNDEKSDNDNDDPRERFTNSLSSSKVEEAKATAVAQLALAFEILEIMKERELKADPIAYKSLIDACGRVGETERATKLLKMMHDDGIVADGVVYSCLVAAFSVENSYGKIVKDETAPEWANGASAELNWNKLAKKSWISRTSPSSGLANLQDSIGAGVKARAIRNKVSNFIARRKRAAEDDGGEKKINAAEVLGDAPVKDLFVTRAIADQIGFGENLLELVYPDISIDTDNERCPKCDTYLLDDDVVCGWTPNPQNYTTQCPTCKNRFVPKFRVQSTSAEFIGSKGPGTPLICERLSPWVLSKELRRKMYDIDGAEDLLDPSWRESENKNSVLWWNLILSFMRYHLPFTFLLQGSFPQELISPMPSAED